MNTKQRTATARVALDPPRHAYPVAIRGAGDTLEVYDGGWQKVRKDGSGRYWFKSIRRDTGERELVTFLTEVE